MVVVAKAAMAVAVASKSILHKEATTMMTMERTTLRVRRWGLPGGPIRGVRP
jgi:hypothetical protein